MTEKTKSFAFKDATPSIQFDMTEKEFRDQSGPYNYVVQYRTLDGSWLRDSCFINSEDALLYIRSQRLNDCVLPYRLIYVSQRKFTEFNYDA